MFNFGSRLFTRDVKKTAIRYLLHKYIGKYLLEKVALENLTFDISNGTGLVNDLCLDCNELNELAESFNLPIKFVDGFIEEVKVDVSWSNLFSESCFVEISGLMLTVQPKQRVEDVSLVDSMIDSMNTSMQIAQECLQSHLDHHSTSSKNGDRYSSNDKRSNFSSNPVGSDSEEIDGVSSFDGVERIAHAIDTFLNKIKIRLTNSIIRLEYAPKQSNCGVALEIRIENIDYFVNAAGSEMKESVKKVNDIQKILLDEDSYCSKHFYIEGITFYTDEFYNEHTSSNLGPKPSNYDESKSVHSEVQEDEDYHCDSNHKDVSNLEPILIAKLFERQEFTLRLRRNDTVCGPKVSFEASCTSLVTFLSPRQVHLLLELSEGILSPESSTAESDKINFKRNIPAHATSEKPLNQSDYKKIEHELLLKHITPPKCIAVPSHALNYQGGWSSPPVNICEDDYVPMTTGATQFKNKHMTSSQVTEFSDLETSFSSTMSSIYAPGATKHDKTSTGNELSTYYSIKFDSVSVVILHEDILIPSTSKLETITPSSHTDMQNKSHDFFSCIGNITRIMSSAVQQDFLDLKEKHVKACPLSNLRFIGTSIEISGSDKYCANKWEMTADISVGWLEAIECINDSFAKDAVTILNELLVFPVNLQTGTSQNFSVPFKPNISILVNQSQNIVNSCNGRSHQLNNPKVEAKITLGSSMIEIDVTLIDRINALLNRQKIINNVREAVISEALPPSHLDNPMFFKKMMDDVTSKPETKITTKICSSLLALKIRFPIPDLRPLSDMERIPWWKRNIRKDIMFIEFQNSEFEVSINHSRSCNIFEVRSDDIHVKFQQNEQLCPISLLRASIKKENEKGFNPVRVLLKIYPCKLSSSLEDEPKDESLMTKSTMGFFEGMDDNVVSIFSKRKVASRQKENVTEINIPASIENINKFMNDTLQNVQYDLELDMPDVQFVLPSKHVFEIVYNRIVSDLLLWMPSAPKISNKFASAMPTIIDNYDIPIGSNLISKGELNQVNEFHLCSSHQGDEKFVTDELNDFSSMYNIGAVNNKVIQGNPNGQTNFGLTITFDSAVGKIQTPYRDSNNKVIPGKNGNLMATFNKGVIYIAAGYKGNIDLSYTCIFTEQASLYHKANNITVTTPIKLSATVPLSTKNLKAVLYPNRKLYQMGGCVDKHINKSSIIMCFKVDFDAVKNEKSVLLSGSLYNMTLRYLMTSSSESWMSQLGDMFNVEDYAIKGYVMPDVLTEFNFIFQYCAIDYRPLHLPLKSFVTIDCLTVSSNLTLKGNSSVLSVLAEDAGLFLSQNDSRKEVNLKENYICIADLGVFEFCMALDSGLINPTQELLITNNKINIRTCSDSCKSLMELLIYLANEGDLVHEAAEGRTNLDNKNKVVLKPSQSEETQPRNIQSTMNKHSYVETLMQEAMMESTFQDKKTGSSSKFENDAVKKEVDVFFFPDENSRSKSGDAFRCSNCDSSLNKSEETTIGDTESALRDALKEALSDDSFEDFKGDTDEEFCILDDIPGTGITSVSGQPKVKDLTSSYVFIKEDHFDHTQNSNENSNDSKNLLKPIIFYSIQEMSIIWHMYGGNDFALHSKAKEDFKNTVSDKNGNHKLLNNHRLSTLSSTKTQISKIKKGPSVSFVNGDANFISDEIPTILDSPSSPIPHPKHNMNLKWYEVGGSSRCHNTLMELQLSKIKFNYEIYPAESNLETRHILSVNDIEVRDRLSSSKINKFLYQFSSESHPKQARANMLQIKALTRKSDPSSNSSEMNVSMSVRPIRLNIDQDALIFLGNFLGEILSTEKDSLYGEEECPNTANTMQVPVMTVNYHSVNSSYTECNPQINDEAQGNSKLESQDDYAGKNMPIYIRTFVFSPEVPIRIDYQGKHIDINSQYGPIAGLIIGLGQLNKSQIILKRIGLKTGVLGVNKLVSSVVNEWMYDIKKNQLPSILGGVGPIHSFVKLFGGLKDLVWLPIEQYHKDGRVFKGLQRGTSAFTTSTAYAALDLSGRFVGCIQSAAETMYDMVSSGPSVRSKSYKMRGGQPKDIREGVTSAFGLVRHGLGDTANTIWRVAAEEHSHKGVSGAVGGVLRQIPPSVVQPIILATEATCTVIGGMTNQLNPDARKEAAEKWKA